MSRVSREVAEADVCRWLDLKRVRNRKRENSKDQIENMIDAVEDGVLSIDEDGVITHQLSFPIGDEVKKESISYKLRVSAGEIKKRTQRVGITDWDGRVTAYISALTGESENAVNRLDSDDFNIANNIALFFMS